MPAPKKVILDYKLNPVSPLAQFVEWYQKAFTTFNPDTGRKRQGNAKKVILEFLENALSDEPPSDAAKHFNDAVKQFKEDTKLPKELQSAKTNLSAEEYKNFKLLYEKIQTEEKKMETT